MRLTLHMCNVSINKNESYPVYTHTHEVIVGLHDTTTESSFPPKNLVLYCINNAIGSGVGSISSHSEATNESCILSKTAHAFRPVPKSREKAYS